MQFVCLQGDHPLRVLPRSPVACNSEAVNLLKEYSVPEGQLVGSKVEQVRLSSKSFENSSVNLFLNE